MTVDKDGLAAALAALKPEIRQMLAEDLPLDRKSAEDAFIAGRWEQLREQVHRVKGSASFCRLEALREACLEVEQSVAAGGPPDHATMARFSAEVTRVLAAL
ncbi:MAG TPA: Hpt domain-containing protein [Gammaproteobacteria bacterium]